MLAAVLVGILCGVSATSNALPHTQIIDGEDVEIGELPYQIRLSMLGTMNFTMCGGALIEAEDRQFVLMTMKCANFMRAYGFEGYRLFAGEVRANEVSDRVQMRQPNRLIIPETYREDFNFNRNDIGIIGFETPFELTEFVQPIRLPEQGQNTTGDVLISGFGQKTPNGSDSNILRKLQVPVLSDEECSALYENTVFTPVETMLCGLGRAGGASHCGGDTGGPVKALDGDYLAGIMSYPETCNENNRTGLPDIYTEVSHYVDWIRVNARDL